MDIFNIGQRIQRAARELERLSRGTGRTRLLIELLDDAPCIIIFAEHEHVRHFKHECARYGRGQPIKHDFYSLVVNPNDMDALYQVKTRLSGLPSVYKMVVYDHVWLDRYHERRLRQTIDAINEPSLMWATRAQDEVRGKGPDYE